MENLPLVCCHFPLHVDKNSSEAEYPNTACTGTIMQIKMELTDLFRYPEKESFIGLSVNVALSRLSKYVTVDSFIM